MPPAVPPDPSALDAPVHWHTLTNGLRVLVCPMPWRHTLSVSVFVRSGSLHETATQAGLSHVVEHMAFKGTAHRTCQQINLAAESLGAELNAHTDKDHTAFHVDGLPDDLPAFIELLADLVRHPSFPLDELERERQVILHELTEVDEDPSALVFQAFDRACYGERHAAGRPVIGLRRNIERFTQAELQAYVARRYGACNLVVAAAGPVAPEALLRCVEAAFGDMPAGTPNTLEPPIWLGGLRQRRQPGSGQCQIVWGQRIPALHDPAHLSAVLTAAVLGEGMSSPLLDALRERQALAYFLACSADVGTWGGQFVIEAATAPAQAEHFLREVHVLMQRLADAGPTRTDLARARKQLRVRSLRTLEQPGRRMESAVHELFALGHVRSARAWLDALQALPPRAVRDCVGRLLAGRTAIGLAGSVPTRLPQRLRSAGFVD